VAVLGVTPVNVQFLAIDTDGQSLGPIAEHLFVVMVITGE